MLILRMASSRTGTQCALYTDSMNQRHVSSLYFLPAVASVFNPNLGVSPPSLCVYLSCFWSTEEGAFSFFSLSFPSLFIYLRLVYAQNTFSSPVDLKRKKGKPRTQK